MSRENISPYYDTDKNSRDALADEQKIESQSPDSERREQPASPEQTLRSVIQLSEDIARYARQVMAMHAEAKERGIDPQLKDNAALQKFEPRQANEIALINLRGDLMQLQTAMFESGIHVSADQLRERMTQLETQGAFQMTAPSEATDVQLEAESTESAPDDREHLREVLRAKAVIEFAFHPDEQIERKYDRVSLQAVDDMMRQVGIAELESLLREHSKLRGPYGEAFLERHMKELAQNMATGAMERLRDAGGPTGGYYGGWEDTEDGGRVLDLSKVDVVRWSHKAKWGSAGMNTMRDEIIEPQEQADLLKGYFAGELAMLSFDREAFRGSGAIDTARLIGRLEGKSDAAIAEEYSGLFADVRNSLSPQHQSRLDQAIAKIGLVWDDDHGRYRAGVDDNEKM